MNVSLGSFRVCRVGLCLNGDVLLSKSITPERKHIISIVKFDKFKKKSLLCCKTTGKHHDKLYPGELLISDLFGRGQSKVQPTNLIRIPDQSKLKDFYFLGLLHPKILNDFEFGLKIAIKAKLFTPHELLEVLDSWKPFFVF